MASRFIGVSRVFRPRVFPVTPSSVARLYSLFTPFTVGVAVVLKLLAPALPTGRHHDSGHGAHHGHGIAADGQ